MKRQLLSLALLFTVFAVRSEGSCCSPKCECTFVRDVSAQFPDFAAWLANATAEEKASCMAICEQMQQCACCELEKGVDVDHVEQLAQQLRDLTGLDISFSLTKTLTVESCEDCGTDCGKKQ